MSCITIILPQLFLNFNKNFQKIPYFLCKTVYKSKYNAKKWKNIEGKAGFLTMFLYEKNKNLTRNLWNRWKNMEKRKVKKKKKFRIKKTATGISAAVFC